MSKATAVITDKFKNTFVRTLWIDTEQLQRAYFKMGFRWEVSGRNVQSNDYTYLRVDGEGVIWCSTENATPSDFPWVAPCAEVTYESVIEAAEEVRKIKRAEGSAQKKRAAKRKWEATATQHTTSTCPVQPASRTIVAVKLRDGTVVTEVASYFDWGVFRCDGDIMSYKVVGYKKSKEVKVNMEQMVTGIAADMGKGVAVPVEVAQEQDNGRTNPKDALGDKKVPLWLLSPVAKAKWAVCQFVGLSKYGAWNWREAGVRSSVYLSAMQRHMDAYLSGEEVDPVDGTPHLGHIMACCAILLDAEAAGKLTDDRPPSVGIREIYAETEAQMARAKENYGHMNPRHYTIADTKV